MGLIKAGTRRSASCRRRGWTIAWLLFAFAITGLPSDYCSTQEAPQPKSQYQQLLARAQQLADAKDYAGAAKAYEQLLRIAPDSLQSLNNLGVLDAHLGKYPQAAQAYERALRLHPGSFPLLVNLGLAYFKGGNYRAAIKSLTSAVSIQPDNFQARTLLGMAYYGAKDFNGASGEFEKLIAAKPNNATLQYLLAESYLRSGQDQKLLHYFEQMLRQSPGSVTIHMLMGEADDGLDRTDQAIKEFKAAAALTPNQPDVNFGLGYLYWKNRQYDQASKAFQREIEAGGDVAKSEAYLGDIALKQGKPRQARAWAEQATRAFPKMRIAHYDLGILDAQDKQYGKAETQLQEAIRLDPSRVEGRYRLAQVYRAEGKTSLAEAELKAVSGIHQKQGEKLFKEISGGPSASN
ncbi:MAG: tetratricopeptide repeat protein [Terriglobia bacterium]